MHFADFLQVIFELFGNTSSQNLQNFSFSTFSFSFSASVVVFVDIKGGRVVSGGVGE